MCTSRFGAAAGDGDTGRDVELVGVQQQQRRHKQRDETMQRIEAAVDSLKMNEAMGVHVDLGDGYEAVVARKADAVKETR